VTVMIPKPGAWVWGSQMVGSTFVRIWNTFVKESCVYQSTFVLY
jgi:hypothetical protein